MISDHMHESIWLLPLYFINVDVNFDDDDDDDNVHA